MLTIDELALLDNSPALQEYERRCGKYALEVWLATRHACGTDDNSIREDMTHMLEWLDYYDAHKDGVSS